MEWSVVWCRSHLGALGLALRSADRRLEPRLLARRRLGRRLRRRRRRLRRALARLQLWDERGERRSLKHAPRNHRRLRPAAVAVGGRRRGRRRRSELLRLVERRLGAPRALLGRRRLRRRRLQLLGERPRQRAAVADAAAAAVGDARRVARAAEREREDGAPAAVGSRLGRGGGDRRTRRDDGRRRRRRARRRHRRRGRAAQPHGVRAERHERERLDGRHALEQAELRADGALRLLPQLHRLLRLVRRDLAANLLLEHRVARSDGDGRRRARDWRRADGERHVGCGRRCDDQKRQHSFERPSRA